MTDEFDEEQLLLDELREASREATTSCEDASPCPECGGPPDEADATRLWMPGGMCSTCWARKLEAAEREKALASPMDNWHPTFERIVPLGPDADAKFVVAPEPKMVVIRHGFATIFLEYFDPKGYSNEELVKKLGMYATFS